MSSNRYKLRVCFLASAAVGLLFTLSLPAADNARDNTEKNQNQNFSHAVLIRLEGMITPMSAEYLKRKLDLAKAENADLIVVEIDSPGGTLEDSLNISEQLRYLDFAHTAAYVPKQALSGAAIAALGCDDILIAPLATIGDAGPLRRGIWPICDRVRAVGSIALVAGFEELVNGHAAQRVGMRAALNWNHHRRQDWPVTVQFCDGLRIEPP